jgi:hypothetical protein
VLLGKKDKEGEKRGLPGEKIRDGGDVSRVKPGMSDALAGETKVFVGNLSPFLPQELIGGSIPHVPGTEDDAVWNAASQACGTEKVHYSYTVDEKKLWYIACPSSTLASNPDSWIERPFICMNKKGWPRLCAGTLKQTECKFSWALRELFCRGCKAWTRIL